MPLKGAALSTAAPFQQHCTGNGKPLARSALLLSSKRGQPFCILLPVID
jgi:hypothetical protein